MNHVDVVVVNMACFVGGKLMERCEEGERERIRVMCCRPGRESERLDRLQ